MITCPECKSSLRGEGEAASTQLRFTTEAG
jgi:hypothetical protein